MEEQIEVKELDSVVVHFSGDSGDGMQLAGNIFTTVSATVGNGVSTFPDYPADIRAPQGSLTGVSGFQVHIIRLLGPFQVPSRVFLCRRLTHACAFVAVIFQLRFTTPIGAGARAG